MKARSERPAMYKRLSVKRPALMQKRREMKNTCFVSFENEMNVAMRKIESTRVIEKRKYWSAILLEKSKSLIIRLSLKLWTYCESTGMYLIIRTANVNDDYDAKMTNYFKDFETCWYKHAYSLFYRSKNVYKFLYLNRCSGTCPKHSQKQMFLSIIK